MRGIFSPDVAIEGMDGSGGDGGAAVPAANGGGAAGAAAPPPFLSKTYDMVDDPATDAIVSWGPASNSFVVWSTPEFSRDLLPKYFKHNNFSSFVRQLNTYGFRKVDPDRWEFANEGFLRGQKHLLKTINRRKPSHVHSQPQQPQAQNSTVAACVEVGKFGLEEEIERLKRDKNVLMQELVRLRQQQQTTDHQLQTLGQRLQGMEQRQQQMMSFLAKAMQSPGFLAQLVQQNESNRRITGVSKKRRFPKQGNELVSERSSPDGQIIKYQPLMNEAANAMLMQILKFDTSQRLDPLSNSDSFMLGNFSSSMEPIGSVNSSNRNSGVTLKEVPTSSGTQYLTASSASSVVPSTSPLSEMQSSAGAVDMVTTSGGVPEAIDQCLTGMNIPGQPGVQGMIPNGNIMNIATENYGETESGYIDPMSTVVDGPLPIDMEDFAVDTDLSIPVDDEDQGLPSINDSFWEQFLQASDAEEVDSGNQEANEMQSEQENGWDSAQRMEHLTEQMGLLSPEAKK